jgi:hypothetical protein
MLKQVKSRTSLVLGIVVMLFLLVFTSTCQANVYVKEDFRLGMGRRFGYPWWNKYYGMGGGRIYNRDYRSGLFWRTMLSYGAYNRGYKRGYTYY